MNIKPIKKLDAIIQARTGSTRLPGKVMKTLGDKKVIEHVIERLQKSKYIRHVIICTTTSEGDDCIYDYCLEKGIKCYRGPELDVLKRYYDTATYFESDFILRVTSDCPLVDPVYIDLLIEKYMTLDIPYLGPKYCGNHKFPDGFNGEIFTYKHLKEAHELSESHEKEHVTTYIIKKYKTVEFEYPIDYQKYKNINFSELHLSLDTQEDYQLLQNIFDHVYSHNKNFTIGDILDYLNNEQYNV